MEVTEGTDWMISTPKVFDTLCPTFVPWYIEEAFVLWTTLTFKNPSHDPGTL